MLTWICRLLSAGSRLELILMGSRLYAGSIMLTTRAMISSMVSSSNVSTCRAFFSLIPSRMSSERTLLHSATPVVLWPDMFTADPAFR